MHACMCVCVDILHIYTCEKKNPSFAIVEITVVDDGWYNGG